MGGSTRTGLLFFLVSLTTAGCEKGDTIDGAALAKEVCACTEKANAMDGSDPGRPAAQDRCRDLQASTWETVKGTPQQDSYNAQFPCGL